MEHTLTPRTTPLNQLTSDNYSSGFLVDEDLMAGVTRHPDQADLYIAFVLQHTTGEYLGYQPFPALDAALEVINKIPRPWTFEKISGGCGGGNCGKGQCKGGGCSKKATKDQAQATDAAGTCKSSCAKTVLTTHEATN